MIHYRWRKCANAHGDGLDKTRTSNNGDGRRLHLYMKFAVLKQCAYGGARRRLGTQDLFGKAVFKSAANLAPQTARPLRRMEPLLNQKIDRFRLYNKPVSMLQCPRLQIVNHQVRDPPNFL